MDRRIDAEYWQIIWNRFKTGERNAFKIIYSEFIDDLFSYGAKITTDHDLLKDSIQDLFVDVYTYGTNLRKPESLEYYLYKTLKRIIIRKLIARNRHSSVHELKEDFNMKFSIEDESFDEETDDSLKNLQNEIAKLVPSQKELLFLKFNSGLTYKEIGKLLNIKTDTVKKQVYRLLNHLRLKLKKV